MFSKISKGGLVLCLVVLSCAAGVQAQESITPAKHELVKELLELTGGAKTTEALLNSMLDQNEKDLPELLTQAISTDLGLTASEREAFRQQLNESAARANKRFRELIKERLNFPQLIDDISYSIYDKYFTEGELRDLVAFYKTPTGRKTIEVLPQLFADSMAKASEAIIPRIQEIMNVIMSEEKARLKSLQPPTKTKRRRR